MQSPWWPFGSLFGLAPAQLNQPILPGWSFGNVTVNYAGNADIERKVVEDVASYGRQLGIITDLVLKMNGDALEPGEDPLSQLREIAAKVNEIKQREKGSLSERASEAMAKLAETDRDAAQRIARDYLDRTVRRARRPEQPQGPLPHALGKRAGAARHGVEMDGGQRRRCGHFIGVRLAHLVLEADHPFLDLEQHRMDGDDVAGEKLALVLDRLLDRRHAALVRAQELRRETERMKKMARRLRRTCRRTT